MKEGLRPAYEKGKTVIAAGTLSALAIVGLTGCDESKSTEWKLNVSCPNGTEPEVSDIDSEESRYVDSSFVIACGDNNSSSAPVSIELVAGPGVKASNKQPASATNYNVSVVGSYTRNPVFNEPTPSLSTSSYDIDLEGEGVRVSLEDISRIERVEVVDNTDASIR